MTVLNRTLRAFKNRIRTHLFQETESNINHYSNNNYRQLEAYLSLCLFLRPRLPLPPTRGWAASPDFLLELATSILTRKPKIIIELGSGLSTLIMAYCLEQNCKGSVLSLEHDEKYADQTRRMLTQHGLTPFATIVEAPLKELSCNNLECIWYAMPDNLPLGAEMLVIDGPPPLADMNPLTRYPALPMLQKHLAADALVFLDDASRPAEQACLSRWRQEIGFKEFNFLPHEKGTAIFSLVSP